MNSGGAVRAVQVGGTVELLDCSRLLVARGEIAACGV